MMTRRLFRFVPALPALLAVTAGALLLSACKGRHCGWKASPEEKAEKIVGHLSEELDLSADQKAKVEAIKNDLLARKADIKGLKEGFHELALGQIRSGSVDAERLNQDLERREAKAKELRAFLVAKFAEFHAVLEPAQREKLAAQIEERRKDCH